MVDVIQKESPNFDDRRGMKPSIILLHYTGMKTAKDALDRLTDPAAEVSSHYTIDEEGRIFQHVDEANRAWHAGKSYWQGQRGMNALSIGIEIVNPGHEWGYKPFPSKQITQVINLCLDIQSRCDIEHVLAHSDVAPSRKEDPGELFPWRQLAKSGIGVWPEISDEDVVKAIGIDVHHALEDFGYDISDKHKAVTAFQRHFVPDVFEKQTQGQVCHKTKATLYALLAGHLLYK